MMIQITEDINQILEKDGTFSIAPRGKVNVPMIGDIKTYWLIGKKDKEENED